MSIRVVAFRPCVIDGVDFVEAWHRTPYGVIRAGWKRKADGTVQYEFSAPKGVEVREPDAKERPKEARSGCPIMERIRK